MSPWDAAVGGMLVGWIAAWAVVAWDRWPRGR